MPEMDPPVVVVPFKRPGRKPIDPNGDSVYVGVTLPAEEFERLRRRAALEDCSIPEIVRRDLEAAKKTKK